MRRRRSGVRWACATVAPWALAASLVVSFTAGAGYDPQAGASSAASLSMGAALIDTAALVPPSTALVLGGPKLPNLRLDRLVVEARLFDPPPADAPISLDPAPRTDLKAEADAYPDVDRTRKGDPLVALRATLSRRGGELRQALSTSASRLIFGRNEALLPPTVLMTGPAQPPDLEVAQTLEPWRSDEATTTRQTSSVQSPAAAAAGSTGSGRGPRPFLDGATPTVARAVALSSTTPAPADATPIEVAAAPVAPGLSLRLDRGGSGVTSAARINPDDKPRYADLIDPDKLDREQHCLAQAVYFEARSEPEEGQAAVAQVILNRVKSGLYPSSVCGVVFQNRHRYKACQFTFTCEGKSLRVTDHESWSTASRVAKEVLEGKTYLAEVGAATHYHANYVRPSWARRLKKMDVIGRHIFYKLRPGQT
jgi:spore germination cell wall hydrolase CwlJ-like protein